MAGGIVHVKVMGLGKIAAPPKPVRIPKPKITAIKVRKVSDGSFIVHHQMSNGKQKEFTFQSPAKMVTHLKRLEQTAWLRPMNDIAPRTAAITDIGMTP